MAQAVGEVRGFLLIATALLALSSLAAGADRSRPNEKTLQPQALDYAGIYRLRQLEPSLTGTGVKFAVICRSINYIGGEPQNDYRPNAAHNCFAKTVFSFHDQNDLSAEVSPHSTAICSILLGADPNASDPQLGRFFYQGAAPRAEADIYEFWHFLINNVFALSPPNADVVTAGIGSPFEDWWTRGIDAMAEQYGLVVVAGIGNGSDSFDPVLYPAAGSNVIGVGVVDSVNAEDIPTKLANFALAYPQHSSFGPTADGRAKPDIIAPGNCLAADVKQPDGYKPAGNWSSFSTPVVAGTVGLLIQKAKQDPNLEAALCPNGRNCLLKAVLLNSAKKLPFWHKGRLEKDDDHSVPLDYVQGAGMLDAVAAYEQLIAGQNKPGDCPSTGWDINKLQTVESSQSVYRINLSEPQDKFVTATLTWNRHYRSTYPFEQIPEQNTDLRLQLLAVDPNDADNSYLLDYSDSQCDNLEHIYARADPNYSSYQIVVSQSLSEPNQPDISESYALAWNVADRQNAGGIFRYDINADGIVDESDFGAVLNSYLEALKTPQRYFLGDINNNGAFDPNDLELLLEHKGQTAAWRRD